MLTAAVAFALEQVMPLPHAFDQAKKKAIRKLTLFEVERLTIAQAFEKARIWYLPLKGIMLKELYPKSAMRQMTDNDISMGKRTTMFTASRLRLYLKCTARCLMKTVIRSIMTTLRIYRKGCCPRTARLTAAK